MCGSGEVVGRSAQQALSFLAALERGSKARPSPGSPRKSRGSPGLTDEKRCHRAWPRVRSSCGLASAGDDVSRDLGAVPPSVTLNFTCMSCLSNQP